MYLFDADIGRSDSAISVEVHRMHLRRARVHFDDFKAPLPEPLQDYINTLKRPRRHPSPGASRIPMEAPLARDGTKSDMRMKLSSVLLLKSWDEEGGNPWVTRLEDTALHNDFAPVTFRNDALMDDLGGFPQAQPESCVGYVPSMYGSGYTAAFNGVQEEVIEDLYNASRACFIHPLTKPAGFCSIPRSTFPSSLRSGPTKCTTRLLCLEARAMVLSSSTICAGYS
jgi:hypothetical protein